MKPSRHTSPMTPRQRASWAVFLCIASLSTLGALLLLQNPSRDTPTELTPPESKAHGRLETTSPLRRERIRAKELMARHEQVVTDQVQQTGLPVTTPPAEPAGELPGFRMCALTRGRADQVSVGIADRATGRGDLLRAGDITADGWRLISANFEKETALFEKDGREYIAHLEKGAALPLATASPVPPEPRTESQPPVVEATATTLRTTTSATAAPLPVFSNRVYHVEGFEPVAVSAAQDSSEFVEVKTGGETYALRREIVESIFKVDNLTTEERLWMMVSYPGLAAVGPGQVSSEQVSEAERKLKEMLVPPTNTPPMEELERLRENFIPSSPPENAPPKP